MSEIKIISRNAGAQSEVAGNPAPSLEAFLSLGFRPLYIAGTAWALVSIFIWIFTPGILTGPLPGPFWHAHEMLWGFIATIAVAFLLTASATWTGHNPLRGWPLALATVLWLIARLGFLSADRTVFTIACLSEAAFYVLATVSLARVILKGKSRRNYGIPLLVAGLGVSNALYLHAARDGHYLLLNHYFDIGLICMAVVALLVARRVIPFFAMRGIPGLKIPMLTRSGHIQMVVGVIAIIAGLVSQPQLMAAALAIAGLIGVYQIVLWKPFAVLSKPILWILYVGYLLMSLGLLMAAAYLAGLDMGVLARTASYVHLIGMGGFSVLIIGMLTRTALGHLGRPLEVDAGMIAMYWLMIIAVAFRLAALWPSTLTQMFLHVAASAWIVLFALYLWRFVPLLIRPRP